MLKALDENEFTFTQTILLLHTKLNQKKKCKKKRKFNKQTKFIRKLQSVHLGG